MENQPTWKLILLALLMIGCAFGFALIGTLASLAEDARVAQIQELER